MDYESLVKDANRYRWLREQPASVQDSVLRPAIPPEALEQPETWSAVVDAAIDAAMGKSRTG